MNDSLQQLIAVIQHPPSSGEGFRHRSAPVPEPPKFNPRMRDPENRRDLLGNFLSPMFSGTLPRVFEEPAVFALFRVSVPKLFLASHFLGFANPFRPHIHDWIRV